MIKMKLLLFFLTQSVLAVSTARGASHLNHILGTTSPKVETSSPTFTTQGAHFYACQRWSCLSQNSNLTLSSTKEQLTGNLKTVLPIGPWHDKVESVVDACYGNVPKKYSRICSEQSFLHCVVQNLIDNCPEEYVRKNDSCSKITSFTSLRYLFSQSRYENMETDFPKDRRPEYFLRNYYNTKCCDLPELFTSNIKSTCGFSEFIHYYPHQLRTKNNKDIFTTTTKNKEETSTIIARAFDLNNNYDPLDCCDMSGFISPRFRADCDFRLFWGGNGLVVRDPTVTTTLPPTTTPQPIKRIDIKIVPLSCEKETCVFKKLNIMSESGDIDIDAFSKLLDSMTSSHPSWKKARARVVTQCLTNPIKHYEGCDINKLLACTFDVLSENCPHAPKKDSCKHTTNLKEDVVCLISSSKYRPKHRRQFCDIPNLLHRKDHRVLSECGVGSINQLEYAVEPIKNVTKKPWMTKPGCKEMTDSSKCLLSKMGILNKYGNMDYFGMKNVIRQFTNGSAEWSKLADVFTAAFTSTTLYKEQCYSPRRLLNVIDAMLMTCPVTKRKVNNECNRFFASISNARRNKTPTILEDNMFYRM